MAGEFEESFSMNFQADSIHSGSISFGRFENEPLSWERRSSFSHNRYLEEVEKYSKPGSVIEKKAYFEAHFKKKGIFGIIPSTGLDGSSDRATSENDGSERIGKQEDFESNDGHYVQYDEILQKDFESNDGHYVQYDEILQKDFESNDGHYVQYDEILQKDFESNDGHYVQYDEMSRKDFELDEGGHYIEMDQRFQEDFVPIEDDNYVQFADIPSDSNYHGECGMDECEREETITEYPMVSFSSLQMESAANNSNDMEVASKKSITLDEAHQSENETSNILSANDKVIMDVKNNDDVTVNTNESSINMGVTVSEPARDFEETILHDPASPSPKETKLKPQRNYEVNNVQVRKSTSSRSAKDPARIPSRESPRRTNLEKNLSKLATPTACSASKTIKEVSKSSEKLVRESKSENVSRVRKGAESQPSALKTASKGIQEAERMNQAINSTKSNVKPRVAAFNFKCNERAERRKEFYMKLEEKMHAKEAVMNQMQAISQEKTEADIKKFRKSLNFKATPMPSFYHTTSPSQPHGNKSQPQAVSNNTRSKKEQNKPKCPGSEADAALPLKSKVGNDLDTDESLTAREPHGISIEECTKTKASEASLTSPAPSTNHSRLADSMTSNHTSGKKEGAKVSSQKHRVSVSDSCKGAKQQNNGRNKNGETTRHRNDITRKGVGNVGLKSSSKSGNLAVRVAS
ncbi:protein WVD2-like 7 [Cajanus cajan]|uniref:protein WVD2-like 7 n=1 Tax=Cajanus cajan TaxID=3821 RepID=UPI00098DBE84|nr:protein WVD2-like 7 [Cajanus cajan]